MVGMAQDVMWMLSYPADCTPTAGQDESARRCVRALMAVQAAWEESLPAGTKIEAVTPPDWARLALRHEALKLA